MAEDCIKNIPINNPEQDISELFAKLQTSQLNVSCQESLDHITSKIELLKTHFLDKRIKTIRNYQTKLNEIEATLEILLGLEHAFTSQSLPSSL